MEQPKDNPEQKPARAKDTRCYSEYRNEGDLIFCPIKDLNLPTSYEEVVDRFRKLQGERAMEVFN